MTELYTVLRFLGTLALVLLVFNFVILVHEWGHFLAARWRGLKVEKFQIWMGKPIWKRTYNGVQYGLGWLPIGGFVALPQMAPMEAIEGRTEDGEPRETLPPVKPIDKIIVAFAGPLFSAMLALFFATLVMFVGKPQSPHERTTTIGYMKPGAPAEKAGLQVGDKILEIDGRKVRSFMGLHGSVQWGVASSEGNPIHFLVERPGVAAPLDVPVDAPVGQGVGFDDWNKLSWWGKLIGRPPLRMVGVAPALDFKVKEVAKNGPAERAGFKPGDVITAINGKAVLNGTLIYEIAEQNEGKPVSVGVKRGAESLELTLVPVKPLQPADRKAPVKALDEAMPGLSFEMADPNAVIMTHPNPFELVSSAAVNSFSNLRAMLTPSSGVKVAHMSGPVGIMNLYYNLVQSDYALHLILFFSVILNMGLAFFNMLPLPVLDGGHITMSLIEMIRGKAASLRVMEVVQTACVLVLLSFVAFVSLKDIGGIASSDEAPVKIEFAPVPAGG